MVYFDTFQNNSQMRLRLLIEKRLESDSTSITRYVLTNAENYSSDTVCIKCKNVLH